MWSKQYLKAKLEPLLEQKKGDLWRVVETLSTENVVPSRDGTRGVLEGAIASSQKVLAPVVR